MLAYPAGGQEVFFLVWDFIYIHTLYMMNDTSIHVFDTVIIVTFILGENRKILYLVKLPFLQDTCHLNNKWSQQR